MSKQKFHHGDWVRIAKDLGEWMSHFTADCEAIVIGSYHDQFGGGDRSSYTLHLKGSGRCSWYYEHQLTLIEPGRVDKLAAWKAEEDAECALKSGLDWIFANGEEVLTKGQGASIQALANCFGLTNLWGYRGEGIVYAHNARGTLELARPFLLNNDKAGWLAYCETLINEMKAGAATGGAAGKQQR